MNMRSIEFGVGLVATMMTVVVLNFAPNALAQATVEGRGPFTIKSIRPMMVQAPNLHSAATGAGASGTANRKWLQIETDFESKPDWVDELTLKYYVYYPTQVRGEESKLFVGEITYVNVPKGTRHSSAMFMHPNTVARYGKGQTPQIAVQLLVKGAVITYDSVPPAKKGWWEQFSPTTGYLLSPQQTPFLIEADQYEAVKTKGSTE